MFVSANHELQDSLECNQTSFYFRINFILLFGLFILRNLIFLVLTWGSSNPKRLLYRFTKLQLIMDSGILLPGIPAVVLICDHYPQVNECLMAEPIKF